MTVDLRMIRLDELEQHPQNPRRDVGDVTELADSIRSLGLMEPLVVAPGADLPWRLIAGHRRSKAAAAAGLEEAPALVREDLVTPAQQLEAMLVENLQRTDLTPVEEADAYEQLRLLGVDAKQIAAATGRSRATVDRRLSLAKLPSKTREKLHAGQITLGDAEALVEFADDDKALKKLASAAGTHEFKWLLTSARQDRERKEKRDAAAAAARAEGKTVLDDVPSTWSWTADVEIKPVYTLGRLNDEAKAAHADTCEHHVLVAGINGDLTEACAKPGVHATEDGGPAVIAYGAGLSEEERAELEAKQRAEQELIDGLAAARTVRQEFLHTVLTKSRRPNSDLRTVMLRATFLELLRDADGMEAEMCEWLGILVDVAPDGDADERAAELLEEGAAVWSAERLTQALFAYMLAANGELPLLHARSWGPREARWETCAAEYMETLQRLGYEPSEIEQRMLQEQADAAAEAAAAAQEQDAGGEDEDQGGDG